MILQFKVSAETTASTQLVSSLSRMLAGHRLSNKAVATFFFCDIVADVSDTFDTILGPFTFIQRSVL